MFKKLRRKKGQEVQIRYFTTITEFACPVNGTPYNAFVVDIDKKVCMRNWDLGTPEDLLVAIRAIENVASRCDCRKMQTYVDHTEEAFQPVIDFCMARGATVDKRDNRFWQYEWGIAPSQRT